MKENISSGVGWTAGVIDSAVTCGANEWPIWTRYTVIRGHAPGGASGGARVQRGGFAPAPNCFWIHETDTHIWISFAWLDFNDGHFFITMGW